MIFEKMCVTITNKPAIFMDRLFLVDASLEVLRGGGGLSRCLADEMMRCRGVLVLGGILCIKSVWGVIL